MLKPNVQCKITRKKGTDLYSQPILSVPTPAKCGVVRLFSESKRSSVRVDSSATRGSAREPDNNAILLFLPIVDLNIGDRVDVRGISLRVVSIFPRFDPTGAKVDHNQVELENWA